VFNISDVIDNLGEADESDDQSGAAGAESFNEVIESGAGIGGNLLGLVCFLGIVVLLSIGNKSCRKLVETGLGWRFLWIFISEAETASKCINFCISYYCIKV
jgi:hypothetical protein